MTAQAHPITDERRSRRGFASMDPKLAREICSRGGKSAHAKGRAHEFTSAEAVVAYKLAEKTGKLHRFTPEQARKANRLSRIARARNRLLSK